ncbi:hypothetical protein [Promicromonospora sukumoe]|uniref:hypothetical protein n=1 Tax=Promicromonospora sukumoe TaxID=88382 RepID=UPI0003A86CFC|nr:hypothetical protein [Promicromonospora sukumoe]
MRTTRMSRLAAAVVVGAALIATTACQADPPQEAETSAPATPSAEPTGQASPSGEPSTGEPGPGGEPTGDGGSGGADAPYEDGYQPPWFEGTDWSCGMPAADLASTSDDRALEVAGELTDTSGGEPSHNGDRFLPVTLTGPAGAVHVSPPATVWTQGGVVVELPALADAAPVETAGGERLDAVAGLLSHCVPGPETGGMATYETELPEGDYEVRAFVEVDPGSNPRQFVLSDPVDVSVTEDGIVER